MGTNYKHRLNWTDGMKINKNHFIDLEDSLIQLMASSTSSLLSKNSYGLLPDNNPNAQPVDIKLSMDGAQSVEIVLRKCNAVTLGGDLIYITDELNSFYEQTGRRLQTTIQSSNDDVHSWYVVISANPFSRIPIGIADPQEEPARQPHILPEYKLNVVPENDYTLEEIGINHLTIAKITLSENGFQLMEDYIPPCTSIQSHPDLRYTYTEIGSFFNVIEHSCIQVIQKILQKKQSNQLASMVMTLVTDVRMSLNTIIPQYRIVDKHSIPSEMIVKVMTLARVIKGSLDIYAGTGKEELINYLTSWCDTNQGSFENAIEEMVNLKYEHRDINNNLIQISNFTVLMITLFKKISELDYIGKKSDSNIFVKEDVIVEEEVKKRRRFFME